MTIIQEQMSKDGTLQSRVIDNVRTFKKGDNIRAKDGSFKYGIWLKATKQETILFPNQFMRDLAFDELSKPSAAVILQLERFFWPNLIGSSKIEEMVTKRLSKHMKLQLEFIIKNEELSLVDISRRDAFKFFTLQGLTNILEEEPVSIDVTKEVVLTWSKTLLTPKEEIKRGINNLQFFNAIIKNEKRWNISSSDGYISL